MTTLVYRSGVLAADSRVVNSSYIVPGPAVKLRKLSDGSLVGFCGMIAEAEELAAWIESPQGDRPGLAETGSLVHIRVDRSVWLYEDKAKPYRLAETEFYAWGSGFPVALGALHMGASAEEAVRIATLVDSASGGPVQSVRLASKEDVARRAYEGLGYVWSGANTRWELHNDDGSVHWSTDDSVGFIPAPKPAPMRLRDIPPGGLKLKNSYGFTRDDYVV